MTSVYFHILNVLSLTLLWRLVSSTIYLSYTFHYRSKICIKIELLSIIPLLSSYRMFISSDYTHNTSDYSSHSRGLRKPTINSSRTWEAVIKKFKFFLISCFRVLIVPKAPSSKHFWCNIFFLKRIYRRTNKIY